MALDEKLNVFTPVKIDDTDVAIITGATVPDGNETPQSDALKSSLYIYTAATADQSPWYLKVDTSSANDDWVHVLVDKDEATRTMEADWTWDADKKVQFRDSGLYAYSPTDGELLLKSDNKITLDGEVDLGASGQVYEEIFLAPENFDVSVSASLALGKLRHTATANYRAINFSACGDVAACSHLFKVPTNAASSGSVMASVVWAASTDGDAAVFGMQFDYIATGEGPGTCSASVTFAASNVSASHITSTSIGNFPSFTAGDYCGVVLQHEGTSGSDDSGSTTDVTGVVLRYVADKLGTNVQG